MQRTFTGQMSKTIEIVREKEEENQKRPSVTYINGNFKDNRRKYSGKLKKKVDEEEIM